MFLPLWTAYHRRIRASIALKTWRVSAAPAWREFLLLSDGCSVQRVATKTDQVSAYKDWYLVGLALALGLTGMLTEMTRLGGMAGASYVLYFVHLMFVWCLFAYTPFSKLAHIVYRTVSMAYADYANRK